MRWLVLLLLLAPSAFCQTQDTPETMARLLAETAQHYRDAKTMRIHRQEVTVQDGDLSTSKDQWFSDYVLGENGRSRVESKSQMFWTVNITNGRDRWEWRPWSKQFTKKTVANDVTLPGVGIAQTGLPLFLAQLDQKLAGGTLLPRETVRIGDRVSDCLVLIGPPPKQQIFDSTWKVETRYWIDRDRKVLVKEVYTIESLIPERRFKLATVRTYDVHLNEPVSDSEFTLVPPPGTTPVSTFDFGWVELVGNPAPPLRSKTLDGGSFDLAVLRGKPVLLDFWATWCGPCRASMPELASIQAKLAQNLVVVGVNQDEDPKLALRFVKENNYGWQQVADSALLTAKEWGSGGIPRVVLIDKNGIVRYDGHPFDEEEMPKFRAALRAIDPRLTTE